MTVSTNISEFPTLCKAVEIMAHDMGANSRIENGGSVRMISGIGWREAKVAEVHLSMLAENDLEEVLIGEESEADRILTDNFIERAIVAIRITLEAIFNTIAIGGKNNG